MYQIVYKVALKPGYTQTFHLNLMNNEIYGK